MFLYYSTAHQEKKKKNEEVEFEKAQHMQTRKM